MYFHRSLGRNVHSVPYRSPALPEPAQRGDGTGRLLALREAHAVTVETSACEEFLSFLHQDQGIFALWF